jgi:hypothetical protein
MDPLAPPTPQQRCKASTQPTSAPSISPPCPPSSRLVPFRLFVVSVIVIARGRGKNKTDLDFAGLCRFVRHCARLVCLEGDQNLEDGIIMIYALLACYRTSEFNYNVLYMYTEGCGTML